MTVLGTKVDAVGITLEKGESRENNIPVGYDGILFDLSTEDFMIQSVPYCFPSFEFDWFDSDNI